MPPLQLRPEAAECPQCAGVIHGRTCPGCGFSAVPIDEVISTPCGFLVTNAGDEVEDLETPE